MAKTNNKSGRPLTKFTSQQEEAIEQMALDNCHFDTIAMALNIPKETLKRRFGSFIQQKRAEGRTELAHVQRAKAIIDKDTTMLIWRGKQDLGQKDKQEHELSGVLGVEIVNYGSKEKDKTAS